MNAQPISSNANHPGAQNVIGWSIRADTAAVVNLRIEVVGGAIVIPLGIPVGVSDTQVFDNSIDFPAGTYVEVVSGTITGSLFTF